MTDLPVASTAALSPSLVVVAQGVPAPAQAPAPAPEAPVATAPVDVAAAPPVDGHAVVTSVVSAVQASPDVHPSKAAAVAATILAGLLQAQPAIFAVSRASAKTQATVSLAELLAEVVLGAFMKVA